MSGANVDGGTSRVSNVTLGIVGTIIATAVIGGASILVDTREDVARLEERVSRAEHDGSLLRELPAAVARLEVKLDQITAELAESRANRPGRR